MDDFFRNIGNDGMTGLTQFFDSVSEFWNPHFHKPLPSTNGWNRHAIVPHEIIFVNLLYIYREHGKLSNMTDICHFR